MTNIRIHPPKDAVNKLTVDLATANIRHLIGELPLYRQILIDHCGADIYLNTTGNNSARNTFSLSTKKQKPFRINLSLDDFASFDCSDSEPSLSQCYFLDTLKEETLHGVQYDLIANSRWMGAVESDIFEHKNVLREQLEKEEREYTCLPEIKDGEETGYARAKISLADYAKLTSTGYLKAKYASMDSFKNRLKYHCIDILGRGEDEQKILHESPADIERIRNYLIESDWVARQNIFKDVEDVMLATFPRSYPGFKEHENKLIRYAELLCEQDNPIERPESWQKRFKSLIMQERMQGHKR